MRTVTPLPASRLWAVDSFVPEPSAFGGSADGAKLRHLVAGLRRIVAVLVAFGGASTGTWVDGGSRARGRERTMCSSRGLKGARRPRDLVDPARRGRGWGIGEDT
jgi:hypothetical protein